MSREGHAFVCAFNVVWVQSLTIVIFPGAVDPELALLGSPAFVSRTCSPSAINTVLMVRCICVIARLLLNAA